MSSFNSQASITGTLKPAGATDTYPTHDAIYGKGGCMQVNTVTARDAIPTDRRTLGMLAIVTDETDSSLNKVYILDGGLGNENWRPLGNEDLNITEFVAPLEANIVVVGLVPPTIRSEGVSLELGDLWYQPETGILSAFVKVDEPSTPQWYPVFTIPAFTGDITTTTGNTVATLANSGVTAGTYGTSNQVPQITVDAKGRVTAATTVNVSTFSLPAFTGDVTTTEGGTVTTLSNTGVVAGSYGGEIAVPRITVDAKGRLTSAENWQLDGDLVAIASLNGTGYARRTGVNTWTLQEVDYNGLLNKPVIVLTADLNLYVSPTGSDSNDGLTAQTPFENLEWAVLVATNRYISYQYKIRIYLAPGTYPRKCILGKSLSSYPIEIIGDENNFSLVKLTGTLASPYSGYNGPYTCVCQGNFEFIGLEISADYTNGCALAIQSGHMSLFYKLTIANADVGIQVQPGGYFGVQYYKSLDGLYNNRLILKGSFVNPLEVSGVMDLSYCDIIMDVMSHTGYFFNINGGSLRMYTSRMTGTSNGGEYNVTNSGWFAYKDVIMVSTAQYGTPGSGVLTYGGAVYNHNI
jgi:hypothetical protein